MGGINNNALCVVFADMVGYTALSARNEAATHTMWMDFSDTCLQPAGEKFGANMMRTLGDGCLVSFTNTNDAMKWCLDVRRSILADRGNTALKWPGLSMRFGLHFCDVIHDNGEIYGDGVNTAKRLQERSQADGILFTQAVHDRLDESNEEIRYLGPLSFKNLKEPVETYEFTFTDAGHIAWIDSFLGKCDG